jgi:hypothetical protein
MQRRSCSQMYPGKKSIEQFDQRPDENGSERSPCGHVYVHHADEHKNAYKTKCSRLKPLRVPVPG